LLALKPETMTKDEVVFSVSGSLGNSELDRRNLLLC
jgi:hypothetical protein